MSKFLDIFAHLSKDELEMLTFKFKTEQEIKSFLTKAISKAIGNKCMEIENSEEWIIKNHKPEQDEEAV
jgi:hypothetical protein